jgi:hypothetical protein
LITGHGKADSAQTAHGFVHGVTTGVLLKSSGPSTCTNSHVSENGDTTKINYSSSTSDTFTNTGLTTTITFNGGCIAPNGDCYFFKNSDVGSGAIYIQYSGTGSLTNLSQGNRSYQGGASISNGDVYTAVYGGSREYIYKRTGGSGNFVATSLFGYWYDIASFSDTLYALNSDSSGYLVKIDPTTSTMIGIHVTPDYQYVKLCINTSGDITMIRAGTYDLYKLYYGTTMAIPLNQVNRSYSSIGIDSSNSVFTSAGTTIYRQLFSSGDFVQFQSFSSIYPKKFFAKKNGDVYCLGTNSIWIKSNESSKRTFTVTGGNSNFGGTIDVENIPVSNAYQWILCKDGAPSNTIKKVSNSNLKYGLGLNCDSLRIYIGATDSLLFYLGANSWSLPLKRR